MVLLVCIFRSNYIWHFGRKDIKVRFVSWPLGERFKEKAARKEERNRTISSSSSEEVEQGNQMINDGSFSLFPSIAYKESKGKFHLAPLWFLTITETSPRGFGLHCPPFHLGWLASVNRARHVNAQFCTFIDLPYGF